MRYLIRDIIQTLEAGQVFVLLTIVGQEGSSPRGLGACMFVAEDGSQHGTIGGGSVEYYAAEHAKTLLSSGVSETRMYRLHTNEVADIGMICGGSVWVLFQRFLPDADTVKLFRTLFSAHESGEAAYLVRAVTDGGVTDIGAFTKAGLRFDHAIDLAAVQRGLSLRAVLTEDNPQLLIEPAGEASRAYLFGGGHVSQRLVPVLSYIGFRTVMLEDREQFADPALFPAAEDVRMCDFSDIETAAPITKRDYVIIMTRGHMADYDVLRQALKTEATYIGCIGSRQKIALTKRKLFDEGFTEADFARVHTPIGLPILAETPEEIAVSVAAELIEHRARH